MLNQVYPSRFRSRKEDAEECFHLPCSKRCEACRRPGFSISGYSVAAVEACAPGRDRWVIRRSQSAATEDECHYVLSFSIACLRSQTSCPTGTTSHENKESGNAGSPRRVNSNRVCATRPSYFRKITIYLSNRC